MTRLGALVYADWRAARNDAARILRSPRRIILWLAYALVLGGFIWSRWHGDAGPAAPQTPLLTSADYFVCALLATLALSLATGRGAIGIFRSRVEARFIVGSPVAAPLAIAYLQAREAFALGLRFIFSLMYVIFVFAPREVGVRTALMDIALIVALIAAGAAIVVPRRLLSAPASFICAGAGLPLGLLAVAPALRDALLQVQPAAPLARRAIAFLPAWHPGRMLLEPNLFWLGIVVSIAAAAIATLAAAGRDAYPELYALAIARIERRERLHRRRREAIAPAVLDADLPQRLAPAGVLAFVWKSVVEFWRTVRPAYVAGGIALWCAAGFVIGRVVGTHGPLFGALVGILTNIIVVTGLGATTVLAGELRRPLFWLSPAPVFERLCALVLARIWRTVVTLQIVAAGFALGGGSARQTLIVVIGLPVLVALSAAIGFAMFALFPDLADQRGPVSALRVVVSIVLLLPPLVVYATVAAGFHAPQTALFGTSLLMLVEAGALVGIAAWRLDGQMDRLTAS